MNKYIFFLLGISFGLPDLAINLGFGNVRGFDVLIALLALIEFLGGNGFGLVKKEVFNLYVIYGIIVIYKLISLLLLSNLEVSSYFLYREILNIVRFILVMSIVIRSKDSEYLFFGLCLGFLLFISQIGYKYLDVSSFVPHIIKEDISFSSLNPNGTGAFLMIFFAGFNLFGDTKWSGVLYSAIWIVCIFSFNRGTTLAITLALMQQGFFRGRILIALAIMCLYILSREDVWLLISKSVEINVTTGEGSSHRYELWNIALDHIGNRPFYGNGFLSETSIFQEAWGGGITHNSYLAILLELGFFGFILYLCFFYQIFFIIGLRKLSILLMVLVDGFFNNGLLGDLGFVYILVFIILYEKKRDIVCF